MLTLPLPSASAWGQFDSGCEPSAMFTAVISSFTATTPSPLQSPAQDCASAAVADSGTLPSNMNRTAMRARMRTSVFVFSRRRKAAHGESRCELLFC